MSAESPTACITGACGDIGQSLARRFAQSGYQLLLCDLTPPCDAEESLAELRKAGAAVVYQQVDVTDEQAVERFMKAGADQLGGLDACVVNAGIVERGSLLELDAKAWRRTLEVNLTGAFFTARAAARHMIDRGGGHIVLISSWVQDAPAANIGAYCASKGGLRMLAKCLALELGPRGVRVNSVAPGWVDAGLTGANLKQNPQRRSEIEKRIPLGRLAGADEVASAVWMLCSEGASYIHGASILVDGGSSLFPER